jgi:hypothetical protein
MEPTKHHLNSTNTALTSTKIWSYITSAKLGDGSWNGTTENFILNGQEQVCQYERLVPLSGNFSDEKKLSMLQTAVHPLQELRQVKATAALLKAHAQKALDYEAYCTLLLSAATDYDSKYMANKGKRLIYALDVIDHDDELNNASYEIGFFDINNPVDTIQAFATKFSPRLGSHGVNDRVRMPKEKWLNLDQKMKDLWYQIDDKYKSIILGCKKLPNSSPTLNKPPIKPPYPNKRWYTNLHDMSAYDFLLSHVHDLEPEAVQNDNTNDDPPVNESDSEPPDFLLINAAKGSPSTALPPGDIRRVLSKSSKRSAKFTHIEYRVSYHKASSGQSLSLIDRGANGGVAGNDVCVIFKTGRAVDLRGIDNHCTNIDIGSVGGVIQTQKVPIIGIMHQYALLKKWSTIHSPYQF